MSLDVVDVVCARAGICRHQIVAGFVDLVPGGEDHPPFVRAHLHVAPHELPMELSVILLPPPEV